MTDKQIMIDGVNVSECEHINVCDNKIKCAILQDDVWKINPHCEGHNCYYKQLKRKGQECDQEKTLKEMYFTYYKAKHSDIKGKLFSYKQTLTKIKEIARWHTTSTDSEGIQDDMKQILQLISEVEDDR